MLIFLALLDLRGYTFSLPPGFWRETVSFERDAMILPEVIVEAPAFDPATVLRPLFDMIWNAFGLLRSATFDAEGRWAPRH